MATEKRLIDANEATKRIRDRILGSGDNFDILMTHLCRILEAVPTVDAVEVVHGRCRKYDEQIEWYDDMYVCLECGTEMMISKGCNPISPKWCPYCGAKMDGGKDND